MISDASSTTGADATTARDLILKAGEARRIRRGHPWVFANEIDSVRSPLSTFAAGDSARLVESDGRFIAWVDVSPGGALCGRVTSRREERPADVDWLRGRITRALALRAQLFAEPFYRLVHGDGDALSGLVIDRFDDVFVVQAGSPGMQRRLDVVADVLEDLFSPRAILRKDDAEGVRQAPAQQAAVTPPVEASVLRGTFSGSVSVRSHGLEFEAPITAGQKTGWYYDQAWNREVFARLPLAGASVLDVYSYVGAFGVLAAARGADRVLCVDSSAPALDVVARNAARNGVEGRIHCERMDAQAALAALAERKERFDIAVVDPPAFIRRRADHARGEQQYRRVYGAALAVLKPDSFLVAASCSALLTADEHLAAVRTAARQARRDVFVVHRGCQAPDHPVHPLVDTTDYLKCLVCRVL